ncbi:MAG: hypothetical protein HFJ03_10935 [Lachnospira sp.]|jgi:hypothetical protein|nr:hypothetical protein [Lachnospira sp.]
MSNGASRLDVVCKLNTSNGASRNIQIVTPIFVISRISSTIEQAQMYKYGQQRE